MPVCLLGPAELSLEPLRGRTIAILGYGSQGRAHALNLRDRGFRVVVGQRRGPRFDEAVSAGFEPLAIGEATAAGDLVVMALPDEAAPEVYAAEIGPRLRGGKVLGFIHGYNVHYGRIAAPAGTDVVLVAPKAQGDGVRREFVAGRGVVCLTAVGQDASGSARGTALAWAAGIGGDRAGVIETTFRDETETDLFGEQAVLCGGLTSLIKAGFETLVEAGYPAELAYFECCHEVKLIADLISERGIAGMRERISSTARFGDLTRGPRVIGPAVREAMRRVLEEIRCGDFAAEWRDEVAAGRPRFRRLSEADGAHALEVVGAVLRKAMGEARSGPG